MNPAPPVTSTRLSFQFSFANGISAFKGATARPSKQSDRVVDGRIGAAFLRGAFVLFSLKIATQDFPHEMNEPRKAAGAARVPGLLTVTRFCQDMNYILS